MSTIIILVIAIAASGVLMTRFRKKWLAKIAKVDSEWLAALQRFTWRDKNQQRKEIQKIFVASAAEGSRSTRTKSSETAGRS